MDKKYLTNKLLLIIVGVCLVCSIIFYYAAYHQINYNENNQLQQANDGNIGEITDGDVISQTFTYNGDYIRKILIKVGTYEREKIGILHIILQKPDGTIIWNEDRNIAELKNNSDMVLEVNQKLVTDSDKYQLNISSKGCTSGNAVTMYSCTQNRIHEGKLYVKEKEISNAELEMGIYGDDNSVFGEYYWTCVLVILCVATVFFMLQRKREKEGMPSILHHIADTVDTYRFLMKQLISRDFKTKYKRSVLGMFWSFLNPLLTMIVQYVVFSTIFRSDINNYPVYLLSATILFGFFTEAVGGGLVSIVGNASLIKKVYVPKYIYPVTKVLSTAINLLISLLPLFVVVFITGEHVNKAYLLIPFVLICLIIFCIGMSLIMSSLMVFFRDMQFLWSIISLLWMYATPMFYPESIIPQKFRFVLTLNPMYHYISFFRKILLDYSSPQMIEYVWCAMFSLIICVIGGIIFNHTQKKFVLYL